MRSRGNGDAAAQAGSALTGGRMLVPQVADTQRSSRRTPWTLTSRSYRPVFSARDSPCRMNMGGMEMTPAAMPRRVPGGSADGQALRTIITGEQMLSGGLLTQGGQGGVAAPSPNHVSLHVRVI